VKGWRFILAKFRKITIDAIGTMIWLVLPLVGYNFLASVGAVAFFLVLTVIWRKRILGTVQVFRLRDDGSYLMTPDETRSIMLGFYTAGGVFAAVSFLANSITILTIFLTMLSVWFTSIIASFYRESPPETLPPLPPDQ